MKSPEWEVLMPIKFNSLGLRLLTWNKILIHLHTINDILSICRGECWPADRTQLRQKELGDTFSFGKSCKKTPGNGLRFPPKSWVQHISIRIHRILASLELSVRGAWQPRMELDKGVASSYGALKSGSSEPLVPLWTGINQTNGSCRTTTKLWTKEHAKTIEN